VKAKEVNAAIRRAGGRQVSQRGSHRKFELEYERPDGTVGKLQTIVPQHAGDIPNGTLGNIEKAFAPVPGEGWLTK
jgi:predicted RNA binding protein YcfA (HicA-like mRNA interferase family)